MNGRLVSSARGERRLLLIAASLALTGGLERLTGAYVHAFEELGFTVATAELDPQRGARGRAAFFVRLLTRALRSRPTLVLASHVGFVRLVPFVQLLHPRVPACVLLHGLEVWDGPRRRSELRGVRACHAVMAVSQYTKSRFEGSWPAVPSATVIHPAVSMPHAGAATIACQGVVEPWHGGLRVLCVARLQRAHRQKGVAELIGAIAHVQRKGYEISLRIVGDGDDRPTLVALTRALAVEQSVSFLGALDDTRLHHEYEAAEAFALPSEQEGFGLVYLEAMSHGLPVIALNMGPIAEVVTPDAGLLIKSRTVEDIAAALATLADDVELRSRMATAGRDHVHRHFRQDLFVGAVRQLLTAIGLPASVTATVAQEP